MDYYCTPAQCECASGLGCASGGYQSGILFDGNTLFEIFYDIYRPSAQSSSRLSNAMLF
jgi:hypothetical protein